MIPSDSCSFCKLPAMKVKRLFEGKNGARICDECATGAAGILADAFAEDERQAQIEMQRTPRPVPRMGQVYKLDEYRRARAIVVPDDYSPSAA